MLPEYLYIAIGGSAVLCLGLVAYFGLRTRVRLRGYKEFAEDIKAVAATIEGVITRDKGDIEIKGTFRGKKLRVRFSNRENTPGCLIEIPGNNQLSFHTVHEQNMPGLPVGRFVRSGRQIIHSKDLTAAKQFLASNGEQLLPRVLLSREWSLRVEPAYTLLLMQAIPRDMTLMFRSVMPSLLTIAHEVSMPRTPFFTRDRAIAVALAAGVACIAVLIWRVV